MFLRKIVFFFLNRSRKSERKLINKSSYVYGYTFIANNIEFKFCKLELIGPIFHTYYSEARYAKI